MPAVAPPPRGFFESAVLAVGPAFVVTVVTRGDERCVAKRPSPRLGDDARARAMIAAEAHALEVLAGNGAPRLVANGEDEHGPFVVASMCPGVALADCVYSTSNGSALVASVLEVLALVHRHGLVHGDPSPANVLVNGARATFVDFGLSRSAGRSSAAMRGAFAGTLAYAAPEVARDGGAATSPASDVFAIAVALLEHVSGRSARPPLAAAALLVHAVEVPIEGEMLDAIVPGLSRALSPIADSRPTADELAKAAKAAARASGAW